MTQTQAGTPLTAARPTEWPACPLPIAAALLLGIVLRIGLAGATSLWIDEAFTFDTTVSGGSVLAQRGGDQHPLGFYYLYRVLYVLFGDAFAGSDWGFRLPCALASCAALLLWPTCLQRLGVADAALPWCVLLLALLPIDVRYAHEARAYAFGHWFGIAVLSAYALARSRPTRAHLAWLAATAAACAHVDAIGLAVPAGLLIYAAARWLRSRAGWGTIVSLVLGLMAAGPYYLFRLWYMFGSAQADDPGRQVITPTWFVDTLAQLTPFGFGRAVIPAGWWPSDELGWLAVAGVALAMIACAIRRPAGSTCLWLVLGAALAGVLLWIPRAGAWLVVAIVLAAGWRATGAIRAQGGRDVSAASHELRWLLSWLMVFPIAGFLSFSVVSGVPFWYRYLFVIVPAIVIWTTLGTLQIARRVPFVAYGFLFLLPLAATLLEFHTGIHRADHRALAATIVPLISDGDGFIAETTEYPYSRFGPLRAYAFRARRPIAIDALHEVALDRTLRDITLRVDEPGPGLAAGEPERLRRFLDARASGRVWILTGEMSDWRRIDLGGWGRQQAAYSATQVETSLWEVVPRKAAAPVQGDN